MRGLDAYAWEGCDAAARLSHLGGKPRWAGWIAYNRANGPGMVTSSTDSAESVVPEQTLWQQRRNRRKRVVDRVTGLLYGVLAFAAVAFFLNLFELVWPTF